MSRASEIQILLRERELLEESQTVEVDHYQRIVHMRGYMEIRETTKLDTT